MPIREVINFLNKNWSEDALPKNKKLLAENITHLIHALKVEIEQLKKLIEKETTSGNGTKTLHLSPYSIIVQSLFNQETDRMAKFLSKDGNKLKIFIPKEITIPESINRKNLMNAIIIK